MKKALILTVLILLTGCADMVAKGNAVNACKDQAGPKPYAGAEAFGLVGILAVSQSDERQAWGKRYNDCMNAWESKQGKTISN